MLYLLQKLCICNHEYLKKENRHSLTKFLRTENGHSPLVFSLVFPSKGNVANEWKNIHLISWKKLAVTIVNHKSCHAPLPFSPARRYKILGFPCGHSALGVALIV